MLTRDATYESRLVRVESDLRRSRPQQRLTLEKLYQSPASHKIRVTALAGAPFWHAATEPIAAVTVAVLSTAWPRLQRETNGRKHLTCVERHTLHPSCPLAVKTQSWRRLDPARSQSNAKLGGYFNWSTGRTGQVSHAALAETHYDAFNE